MEPALLPFLFAFNPPFLNPFSMAGADGAIVVKPAQPLTSVWLFLGEGTSQVGCSMIWSASREIQSSPGA